MGIPIVVGREFAPTDDEQAPNAVIVNEHVAEQVWPGENAVGKTIVRGEREWTVVGVANNAVYYEVGEDTESQTYHPFFQNYQPQTTFTVETAGDPMAMLPAVEQVIRDYDRNIAISNIRALDDVVAGELGQFRVARRTREIGIRMALGAFQSQVAGAVMARGLTLAAVGILIGVVAAYASAQLIESMLFGVQARDPLTFVTVPLVLLSVAVAASLIPAVRASRVDPMEALREE